MTATNMKKSRHESRSDLFDALPDDILISILCKLTSTAARPSDFFNILPTCKRLNRLALHPLVLQRAAPEMFAVRAASWSDSAHRFFKQCVVAGSIEACYTLGMIRFYCLQNRRSGASLMAKAAIRSHAPALYSLAIIQFNGSSGLKDDKDIRAGVALCARAAYVGHADALRELGHCLQDGYGVRKSVGEGCRLLFQANARELACIIRSSSLLTCQVDIQAEAGSRLRSGLWSDIGWAREVHPANRFLVEWFGSREEGAGDGLSMCCCGRPEIRVNEFRRCSGCGKVKYCSRGCQTHDWKMRHKVECAPMEQWMVDGVRDDAQENDPTVQIH